MSTATAANSNRRKGAGATTDLLRSRKDSAESQARTATQMSVAKNAIKSRAGGFGILHDARGNRLNQSTQVSNNSTSAAVIFARITPSPRQMKLAARVKNPRGTIKAVRSTAGMLLAGPEMLARWK